MPQNSEQPKGTAPAAVVKETTKEAPSSAGVLVLQWLTYAFWGWLIASLAWLMIVILTNAILDEPITGMVPYAIAASVVLLPLAFVTDLFYRKHEPLKKVGGAVIIMVIHAVIFALLGITALIVTVFTGLNMVIETDNIDGKTIAVATAGFATVLYAAAFLRTLNPFKNRRPLFIYSVAMLAITIILLVLAAVGPLAKSFASRNDRLIEQNLSYVETAISQYVRDNNKLPDSLSDLTLKRTEAAQLVKDGKIEYKREEAVTKNNFSSTVVEHRYQLCVEYGAARNEDYRSSYQTESEYSAYISTSYHGAGKECYKLQTTTYSRS